MDHWLTRLTLNLRDGTFNENQEVRIHCSEGRSLGLRARMQYTSVTVAAGLIAKLYLRLLWAVICRFQCSNHIMAAWHIEVKKVLIHYNTCSLSDSKNSITPLKAVLSAIQPLPKHKVLTVISSFFLVCNNFLGRVCLLFFWWFLFIMISPLCYSFTSSTTTTTNNRTL